MRIVLLLLSAALVFAQDYDLLLKGGHVIDPKNQLDGVMDVAIQDGKIARVAADIPAAQSGSDRNVLSQTYAYALLCTGFLREQLRRFKRQVLFGSRKSRAKGTA